MREGTVGREGSFDQKASIHAGVKVEGGVFQLPWGEGGEILPNFITDCKSLVFDEILAILS
jgi:hypothetical protein